METKKTIPGDGNIRPFGDGTAGDTSRAVTGKIDWAGVSARYGNYSGVLYQTKPTGSGYTWFGDSAYPAAGVNIDTSLGVPTGPENSVRTLSSTHWRRVPEPV